MKDEDEKTEEREDKIDEEAVEQTFRRQCEEAEETEDPPVYVDADSCPMAARILRDLGEDGGMPDSIMTYIDDDGNEVEVQPGDIEDEDED